MGSPEKDYLHKGWMAAAALIAVLVAVSFIPPQSLGGVKLRRANILSDLIDFGDAEATAEAAEPQLFDEEEFHVDMEEVISRIEADSTPREAPASFEWDLRRDTLPLRPRRPDTVRLLPELTPIEDFDTTGTGIRAFCDTLLHAPRPVRIAFLGDSFVEGDILTADLREKLQAAYGGGGTGFAPMASPLTGFRRTVHAESKGWTTYNIMQRKKAPEGLRDHFFVSGWVSQPAAGASTRWENTDARARLDSCTGARLLFRSPGESRIEVTLNDTLRRTFDIPADEAVRQIVIRAPHIHALTCRVLTPGEGFIGYGGIFEGDGVVVDNYSVRSNNGQAMFWTDPAVNARIDALAGYDLVILQYGLNIMQAGVHNYTGYSQQIEKMVDFVRRCFPGAAVLVLGVSDRSVKNDGADGCPAPHDRKPAPRSPEHGCGLLAHVQRHAGPGRHGALRAERLGRQGLYPHQLCRRQPRGLGAGRCAERTDGRSSRPEAGRGGAPRGRRPNPEPASEGPHRPDAASRHSGKKP